MVELSKYDVLFYLTQIERPEKNELIKALKMNIFFEKVSERTVLKRLRELKKDGFAKDMSAFFENPKTYDLLAFIFWARMKQKDYNNLLEQKSVDIFGLLFEHGSMSLGKLMDVTKISKPTALKYIRMLENAGFVSIVNKRPLKLEANLNDLSFFYVNFLELSYTEFEKKFKAIKIRKRYSKRLIDATIRQHVRSTTVTEGNTATDDDVDKIFRDSPVGLTPTEVTEILNTHSAVNRLFSIYEKDISVELIKELHSILMNNLMERPGEFHYGIKRIMGFKTKLPASRDEIDFAMQALLSFCGKDMRPVISSAIAHFIFVSIHPFLDGNGRIARLIHSWILLKAGLSLFVFDPEKRYEYFKHLESGREESMDEFIMFCIKEHEESLERIV